jgi:hypothetical protein
MIAEKLTDIPGTENVRMHLNQACTQDDVNMALDTFYDWADENKVTIDHEALQ